MQRAFAVLFLLALSAAPAFASSGANCETEDNQIALNVDAVFSRGLGGGMVTFKGALTVKLPGTPAYFKSLQLTRKDASQVWYYGNDVKFQIHRDRERASIDLVIETSRKDEDEPFKGTYVLRMDFPKPGSKTEFENLEARGEIECSGE